MKNKIKFVIIVICLVVTSFYFSDYARRLFVNSSNFSISFYENVYNFLKNKVNEHFAQAKEIKELRSQNLELEKSAALLSTFAYELNNLLSDKNSTKFSPRVELVRALSYARMGDYNKIWLDFKDFDPHKIYGLIYKGKSAGIVVNKDGKPLALLQTDPHAAFSVYIGSSKISGIAKGNYKNIVITYISQWLEPKIGDWVYTSGLDGAFFGGVPVGRVTEIKNQDLYKSVIVEPENKIEVPLYLYVVTKEK